MSLFRRKSSASTGVALTGRERGKLAAGGLLFSLAIQLLKNRGIPFAVFLRSGLF